jgi:archaellum biogenesis protein FlaJ (TadC family)
MLTETERRECKLLLDKLSTEDIISLTDTVCNRMVSTDSREEALEAILMYSESAKQLLRRKKVRREHIFQYLAEKQIYASASADKTTLMRKVLDLWGTPPDVGSTIRDEVSKQAQTLVSERTFKFRVRISEIMSGRGRSSQTLSCCLVGMTTADGFVPGAKCERKQTV